MKSEYVKLLLWEDLECLRHCTYPLRKERYSPDWFQLLCFRQSDAIMLQELCLRSRLSDFRGSSFCTILSRTGWLLFIRQDCWRFCLFLGCYSILFVYWFRGIPSLFLVQGTYFGSWRNLSISRALYCCNLQSRWKDYHCFHCQNVLSLKELKDQTCQKCLSCHKPAVTVRQYSGCAALVNSRQSVMVFWDPTFSRLNNLYLQVSDPLHAL